MDTMQFDFRNTATGESREVTVPKWAIQGLIDDYLYDRFADSICGCQPVGETNVVDCNCEDIVDQYKLVKIPIT